MIASDTEASASVGRPAWGRCGCCGRLPSTQPTLEVLSGEPRPQSWAELGRHPCVVMAGASPKPPEVHLQTRPLKSRFGRPTAKCLRGISSLLSTCTAIPRPSRPRVPPCSCLLLGSLPLPLPFAHSPHGSPGSFENTSQKVSPFCSEPSSDFPAHMKAKALLLAPRPYAMAPPSHPSSLAPSHGT